MYREYYCVIIQGASAVSVVEEERVESLAYSCSEERDEEEKPQSQNDVT